MYLYHATVIQINADGTTISALLSLDYATTTSKHIYLSTSALP